MLLKGHLVDFISLNLVCCSMPVLNSWYLLHQIRGCNSAGEMGQLWFSSSHPIGLTLLCILNLAYCPLARLTDPFMVFPCRYTFRQEWDRHCYGILHSYRRRIHRHSFYSYVDLVIVFVLAPLMQAQQLATWPFQRRFDLECLTNWCQYPHLCCLRRMAA